MESASSAGFFAPEPVENLKFKKSEPQMLLDQHLRNGSQDREPKAAASTASGKAAPKRRSASYQTVGNTLPAEDIQRFKSFVTADKNRKKPNRYGWELLRHNLSESDENWFLDQKIYMVDPKLSGQMRAGDHPKPEILKTALAPKT